MEPRDVSNASSSGSLLRLFESDFFDSGILLAYLYRAVTEGSTGVQDYLINRLYQVGRRGHRQVRLTSPPPQVSDVDVEFYLPQLTNLLVCGSNSAVNLERFLLDKVSASSRSSRALTSSC